MKLFRDLLQKKQVPVIITEAFSHTEMHKKSEPFPSGHFYSPVVDRDEIRERSQDLWPHSPQPLLGIDFNDESHISILRQDFPQFINEYNYPEAGDDTAQQGYFSGNSQFGHLDSRALFVLLRKWRPRKIIEIGSGFSTLLMADVNARFLGADTEISCIEPFPRDFLKDKSLGIARLVKEKVQGVDMSFFSQLAAGDILFIDSSHVSKTGSDVNYLYFEVLPRLAKGVKIHVHDIFFPNEYPQHWVLDESRSWNEMYILRALLMYSKVFRVIFGSSHANAFHTDALIKALARPDKIALSGGSIWIEKTA